ncbi:hypothetical protein CFP56_008925, partial [Quercus suber]
IYKLQHIERLSLYGDVIFPKELKNDRRPPCDSFKGLSQYIFPSLNYLSLSFFKIRAEIDFILTSFCPLSLESLYITDSNVVTLPKFFGIFERLHTLFIERCNELLEIPSLPQSIIKVLTSNCHSLDSQLSSKLFLQVSLSPSLSKLLRNNLYFLHKYMNRFANLSFVEFANMIQFGEILGLPPNISCLGVRSDISMDPQRTFRRGVLFKNRFDHLWFYCRPPSSLQKQFQDLNLGCRNHVELFCEIFFPPFAPKKSTPFIKGMGVHVECICAHSPPQNSGIFCDNYEEVQPRCGQISKRIVHKRLRPSLLRGPGFILRRQLCHTLCLTRSTSHQQLLKAQKISINNSRKRKKPLVERSCI